MDFMNSLEKIALDRDLLEGELILVGMKNIKEREKILKRADKKIPEDIRELALKLTSELCCCREYASILKRIGINYNNIKQEDKD